MVSFEFSEYFQNLFLIPPFLVVLSRCNDLKIIATNKCKYVKSKNLTAISIVILISLRFAIPLKSSCMRNFIDLDINILSRNVMLS